MALFSDVDWIILVSVGAFLLLGKENKTILRTLGQWYGKATRLKRDLLTEFTQAANLPVPVPGQILSVRSALLGYDVADLRASSIPTAVARPPAVLARAVIGATAGEVPLPHGVWSLALPAVTNDVERDS